MASMNYFDIPEVLIQLIKFSDRATWKELYLTHHQLMNEPLVIKELQNYYNIPGNLSTFADFLFEYDLRHKEWRDKLCIDEKRMINHAIKSEDVTLLKELISDETFHPDNEIGFLAGTVGNTEIIDLLISRRRYIVSFVMEGLAYAGRNDLFNQYKQEYGQNIYLSMITEAARGSNNVLVKLFYDPRHRKQILLNAAAGNNSELIDWISKSSPLDQNDHLEIVIGAIRGGKEEILNRYNDKEIREMIKDNYTNENIIEEAVLGNNPVVLERIFKVLPFRGELVMLREDGDLVEDPYIINDYVEEAFKAALKNQKDQIIKHLLSTRYEELATEKVYLVTPSLIRNRLYEIHKDLGVPVTFKEILEAAQNDNQQINYLTKIYKAPAIDALESTVEADNLDLTKWIIEKFEPDDATLHRLSGWRNCTERWIGTLLASNTGEFKKLELEIAERILREREALEYALNY